MTLDFVGCCDVSMAGREANLIAASQLYHRRRVSWETDFEGLVATRGDVVLLSHDLASWAYSGRLLAGSRGQLQLDSAVPLGASGWVGIRFPDGRYATYRVKTGSGDSDTLQLRDLIPASDAGGPLPVPDESPDGVPYDWMWFYDNGAQPGRRVKIVDVKPSGDGVKFTAIDDNPAYYAAESGISAAAARRPAYRRRWVPAAVGVQSGNRRRPACRGGDGRLAAAARRDQLPAEIPARRRRVAGRRSAGHVVQLGCRPAGPGGVGVGGVCRRHDLGAGGGLAQNPGSRDAAAGGDRVHGDRRNDADHAALELSGQGRSARRAAVRQYRW
ncbi:phage tail protein [Chromobacterium vaccinii]|uniref:phage tail protein n=1 Tax=Chromobacterium vaccinii TaxID=1108595 RepID=UPI001319C641|nr:phage tail protein [Chromobacterium vaccinii]